MTECSSVLLTTVAGVEFRLTPSNRLFILEGRHAVFPYLRGNGSVGFDSAIHLAPDAEDCVVRQAARLLVAQREVRRRIRQELGPEDPVFN